MPLHRGSFTKQLSASHGDAEARNTIPPGRSPINGEDIMRLLSVH